MGRSVTIAAIVGAILITGCQNSSGPATRGVLASISSAMTPQVQINNPTPISELRPIVIEPRERDPMRVKLRGLDLTDGDFRNADLRGADLSALNLRGANFTGANLTGADFTKANLAGAVFTKANIRGTNFEDAAMPDTILGAWNMELANFDGVAFARNKLPKDLFRGRRLVGNVFANVDLSGADFRDSNLIGVSFQNTNLSGADFRRAVLKGVDLPGASLRFADISGMRFQTNGLYEGRDDLFVWVIGMAKNEIPPTIEQIKGELAGRLTTKHAIRKFQVPPLPRDVFANACADPNDMADLPAGVIRPGACS